MKTILLFSAILIFSSSIWSQKSLRAITRLYSKKELNSFKEQNGNLDLLLYAYDNAITVVFNNGDKSVEAYPQVKKTAHFTDLNVRILPYTQYFRTETPGELLAVKSLYQLQLAYQGSKK